MSHLIPGPEVGPQNSGETGERSGQDPDDPDDLVDVDAGRGGE